MDQLLSDLKEVADVVVIDGPPLFVTDAMILASKVSGVLMVVRPGHTRQSLAKTAMEHIKLVGARVVGVVLNRIPLRGADYYAGNGYLQTYYSGSYGDRPRRHRQGRFLWIDRYDGSEKMEGIPFSLCKKGPRTLSGTASKPFSNLAPSNALTDSVLPQGEVAATSPCFLIVLEGLSADWSRANNDQFAAWRRICFYLPSALQSFILFRLTNTHQQPATRLAGMVMTHAVRISAATLQRTLLKRSDDPTPMIAELTT